MRTLSGPALATLFMLASVPITSAEPAAVYLPPQNLQWNQTSPTTVDLTWEAPLDAEASTTYNIYRGDDLLGSTLGTSYSSSFSGIGVFRVVAVHHEEAQARASWQTTLPQVAAVESVPAWAIVGLIRCTPVGASIFTSPPWIDWGIHPECLPP